MPPVINISPAEMKARYQNWALAQANNRIIFVGNTDGLFMYNGSDWKQIKTEFSGTVRAVHQWNEKVFVGAYGKLGYLTQPQNGMPKYHSLDHMITDRSLEKEEIWHITDFDNKIYFQSFSTIWVYNGVSIKKILPPGNIMFVRKVGHRLLVQVIDSGIFEIKQDYTFHLLPGTESLKDFTVSGILQHQDGSLLISTEKNGIYKYHNQTLKIWNIDYQSSFQNQQVNRFISLRNDMIAMGTIRNGVIIADINGNVIFEINKKNAIQNNTVLSLMEDEDGNLWAGLDKGISYIQLRSSYYLYPDIEGQLGTVYTALEDDEGNLILGTNQGIFIRKKSATIKTHDGFELIDGSQGHVWQLLKTQHGILAGHNSGSFLIDKKKLVKISPVNGGYFTLPITQDHKILLQGTYTGLITLEYKNGWKLKNRLKGIDQPVKAIVKDSNNSYWISGPVSGIYKISLNESFNEIINSVKYDDSHGLTSGYIPEIIKISDSIYVKQKSGYYKYNSHEDRFEPSGQFKFLDQEYSLRSLGNDKYCKIYRDSLTIFNFGHKNVTYRLNIQKDFFSITELSKNRFIFCLDEGYATNNISNSNEQYIRKNEIVIQKIDVKNSDVRDFAIENIPLNLSYDQNSFVVYYYQPVFSHKVKFRIKLEGYDLDWRKWTDATFTEFNNIGHGNYKFLIQSDSSNETKSISIYIAPPWYLSKWSLLLYIAIIFLMVRLLSIYLQFRIHKTEEKLKQENERLVREHKIELENQQLQAANIAKSKELANTTIHLVKKNELLQEIKDELNLSRKNVSGIITGKDFQKLMHLINENLTTQDDWQLFESNFNEVHESFMKRLKSQFPQLTHADLILSAYLKMNLTTKEIAPLFNLSVRGLENKRYRLRKKLGLPFDSNLSEFFSKID